jgi:hypothetical protein
MSKDSQHIIIAVNSQRTIWVRNIAQTAINRNHRETEFEKPKKKTEVSTAVTVKFAVIWYVPAYRGNMLLLSSG